MDWQPIETVPKNGKPTLLLCKAEGICIGAWIDGICTWRMLAGSDWAIDSQSDYWGTEYKDVTNPTHWLPLPKHPEAA